MGDMVVVAGRGVLNPIDAMINWRFRGLGLKYGQLARNPITGDKFVWGADSIHVQKGRAALAVQAKYEFDSDKPIDWPSLPLSETERSCCASTGALGQIIAAFAKALATNNWDSRVLPDFEDYACGMTAHPTYGKLLSELDPAILKIFPPRPLTQKSWWAYYWI